MYRMLIVDDEEIITDGLYDIFNNLDLELDLYKAYSGEEALQWMRRSRFDIVLTDINMPEMDGLELIEEIRSNWPYCKLIILTGYSDFDAVYKAIQWTGIRYLLKSEGYDKLIDAVKDAIADIEQQLRNYEMLQESMVSMDTLDTFSKGNYVRHLIFEGGVNETTSENFRRLNIDLDPDKPVLIVVGGLGGVGGVSGLGGVGGYGRGGGGVSGMGGLEGVGGVNVPGGHSSTTAGTGSQRSYAERQEMALDVKLLADQFFNHKIKSISMIDRYGDLIWLVQPLLLQPMEDEKDSYERTIIFLEGTFELIQQACKQSLGVLVSITMGKEPEDWKLLHDAYDKLRERHHMRAGDGTSMVQTVQLKEPEVDTQRWRFPREKVELLSSHLEGGRRSEFLTLFDDLTTFVLDAKGTVAYSTELYYTISLALLSYMNRWEESENNRFANLMQIKAHASWQERFMFLRETADYLFELRMSGEQNRAVTAIDKISEFIEANIGDDLSLIRLADVIDLNPSYLSRLFKQERGLNLSEYIEELRFMKAKELLIENEMKISEVALKVGYDAPHSFTRFFKRWAGVPPQEYRDQAQHSQSQAQS